MKPSHFESIAPLFAPTKRHLPPVVVDLFAISPCGGQRQAMERNNHLRRAGTEQ